MKAHTVFAGVVTAVALAATPAFAKGQLDCKPRITGTGISKASPPQQAKFEAQQLARQDYIAKVKAAYGNQLKTSINLQKGCAMLRGQAFKCSYSANPCVTGSLPPSRSKASSPVFKAPGIMRPGAGRQLRLRESTRSGSSAFGRPLGKAIGSVAKGL